MRYAMMVLALLVATTAMAGQRSRDGAPVEGYAVPRPTPPAICGWKNATAPGRGATVEPIYCADDDAVTDDGEMDLDSETIVWGTGQ